MSSAHAGQRCNSRSGTVIANLAGCFAIGLLAGLIASERITLRADWREFVFVGLLGGFTTFSAFGLDTLVLSRTAPTPSGRERCGAGDRRPRCRVGRVSDWRVEPRGST